MMEGSGSGFIQTMADPDPGGPKFYGSGSAALLRDHLHRCTGGNVPLKDTFTSVFKDKIHKEVTKQ